MKVLVAVENDQNAKMAFASLEQREWPADTEFILVHIIESENYNVTGSLESIQHQSTLNKEKEREYQKQYSWLHELVANNQALLGNMRCVILTGNIEYCLEQVCSVIKPNYFVMTSHERSVQQRVWLKSICASVCDHLDCSLEVIKPSNWQGRLMQNGSFDMIPRRILVAVDGSENSLRALDWLVDQELPCDTLIKLVMVLEGNRSMELENAKNLHSFNLAKRWSTKYNFRQFARDWFNEQLDMLKSYLKDHIVEGACVEGEPVAQIISTADKWDADLIILGSHGGQGLCVDGAKKSAGSTTRALIEQSHKDIIVINSNSQELPVFKWKERNGYSLQAELGKVSK